MTAAMGKPGRPGQILEAARACFRDEGFHGASMSRIAARAGVSVGHIYRYFESKEAVISAIVEADLDESMLAIAALPSGPDAQFEVIVEAVRERAAPEPMAIWLEIIAEAGRNPRVAERVRLADAQLRRAIAATLSAPGGGPADPADACARAELLCTLFEGALLRSIRAGCADPLASPGLRKVVMAVLRG